MSASYSSTSEWLRPWIANANHLSNPGGVGRLYRARYVLDARSNVVDWLASSCAQLSFAVAMSGMIGCGEVGPTPVEPMKASRPAGRKGVSWFVSSAVLGVGIRLIRLSSTSARKKRPIGTTTSSRVRSATPGLLPLSELRRRRIAGDAAPPSPSSGSLSCSYASEPKPPYCAWNAGRSSMLLCASGDAGGDMTGVVDSAEGRCSVEWSGRVDWLPLRESEAADRKGCRGGAEGSDDMMARAAGLPLRPRRFQLRCVRRAWGWSDSLGAGRGERWQVGCCETAEEQPSPSPNRCQSQSQRRTDVEGVTPPSSDAFRSNVGPACLYCLVRYDLPYLHPEAHLSCSSRTQAVKEWGDAPPQISFCTP